ncbi:MAG: nuclear transport factor 2 family protein [Telluria sp.]
MSEQANIDLVKKFYKAYIQGDGETVLSLMSPGIEWIIPDMPGIAFSGTRHGKEQLTEFFQTVAASQQLRRFEPREFFAGGDKVVVLGHHDWTVRATCVEFGSDWAHTFTVQDGAIAAFSQMMDTYQVVEAYRQSGPAAVRAPVAGAILRPMLQ